jgi:hypothetical protein
MPNRYQDANEAFAKLDAAELAKARAAFTACTKDDGTFDIQPLRNALMTRAGSDAVVLLFQAMDRDGQHRGDGSFTGVAAAESLPALGSPGRQEEDQGHMTWHHVALILVAACMVLVCGISSSCTGALPSIVQLATVIVSGALGHAGAGLKRPVEPKSKE